MCHSAAAQDATASTTVAFIDPCSLPAVLVLPEDIVAEILLRLAIKPLFKFKCVSKRYKSIISEPQFAQRYLQRARSSPEASSSLGLSRTILFPYTGLSNCFSKKFEDVCKTDNNNNNNNSTTRCHGDDEDDELSVSVCSVSLPSDVSGEIIASSNGLIVSTPGFWDWLSLHVYNPITKQGVRIPQSKKLSSYIEVGVGIATMSFLSYKIVMIRRCLKGKQLADKANTSVEIFSSETGSWASWELRGCPGELFNLGVVDEGFSYKGVWHMLCRKTGLLVTYDPYNSPDRLGCIPLPEKRYPKSDQKSLVFSGDQGVVKYYEFGRTKPGVQEMCVWRLVDGGAWCWENVFSFPSVVSLSGIMVHPNPWNPDIVCCPVMVGKKVTVLNTRTGRRRCVDVFDETKGPLLKLFNASFYKCLLYPIELCPWSSPFYAQTT